ncbi:hypothetical protein TL16_g02861, partial [Triparma laevis f. inornata]|uniref:Histone-binding protein RBBP4-like N-terminal domain-containing protein n=2 Tax=Triparma laevis TaxID=1534972 RepID=A0A9W7AE36_9STRA
MGKKSKRKGGSNGGSGSGLKGEGGIKSSTAPSERGPLEETADNLRFEDPFEDEFGDEEDMEIVDESSTTANPNGMETTTSNPPAADVTPNSTPQKQAWMPGQTLSENETLEYDQSAYTMYHALRPEWPCLSFDILKDGLGVNRSRFPHTMFAVAGTQADENNKNKLTVMKLDSLSKTYRKTDSDSEDDMSDSDSDNENDADPILSHCSIPHFGGVNRVRSMPQKSNVVATHGATGHVHVWNLEDAVKSADTGVGKGEKSFRPLQSYGGHKEEGYAVDWSGKMEGRLVTGDCSGGVCVWNPSEGGKWTIDKSYQQTASVEDLQWSPTEPTVFASADCNGEVSIFDVRKKGSPMLKHKAHESDVNVISWNHNVSNLLASGSDDGVFSVWDLRSFGKEPLARFNTHTTPITSLEWHPTDESMICVSDESAVFVYDLSVEEDAEELARTAQLTSPGEKKIPAQLLFLHAGSVSNKECHWHPQIPSLVMTTALSGFNIFIPSNL